MSDMSTPPGNPGGEPPTPVVAALASLPARIRVHALAKLLDKSSREVLNAVTELGADGRSVQSSIDRELALRVAEALGVTAAEPAAAAEAAEVEEQPAPPPSGVQAPGFRQTATRVVDSPGFSEPRTRPAPPTPVFASASPLFLPPEPAAPVAPTRPPRPPKEEPPEAVVVEEEETDESEEAFSEDSDEGRPRRRRGRRGRGRGKGGQDDASDEETVEDEPKPEKTEKPDKPARRVKAKEEPAEAEDSEAEDAGDEDSASRRRRRRRRRRGGDEAESTGSTTEDDPPNTVVHVREAREARETRDREEKPESDGRDEVRSVRGSTRLEAKRQRRRDGREAGRRRAPILSEAEFLARREAVDRAMVIRERGDRIQIGVLEDGVLVEHFVTSAGSGSLVGNVYLGRVQNVLPSMEAAFVDIGRGRNAVLYAGEVDWDAAGLEGKARKIEQALSTGDSVLVQVTKDPVGHKGARLTTQISLPGRFLVYVPGGGATGISRKLPENERRRLKDVLKRVVPEDAGVIIRTASEGIAEEELARDVRRLQAQWQVIKDKTEGTNGTRKVGAPSLVYEEPDLLVKVVRDLFTEDFSALVVQGDIAWETVDAYVRHVAPELSDRLRKHTANTDAFAEYRIDEQLLKALDRKVWLPSGGYLVIDRTEAMTVIDVNTGKFTGSGGNLEETVTRNNLESAEEIVRQLRLRDIGGIIVIDFIDMVLESNRDLVLRRLTECLGRDRTRHQVAEVTSLGLVQMTRKRVGTGLLEAFGTTCEHCKGRGVLITTDPVSRPNGANGNGHPEAPRGNTRRTRGDAKDKTQNKEAASQAAKEAVRDIAKATTKAVEPEPAEISATPDAAPEEPTRDTPRHRTRTRAHRAESRNGTPASAEPVADRSHEHVNGAAGSGTSAESDSSAMSGTSSDASAYAGSGAPARSSGGTEASAFAGSSGPTAPRPSTASAGSDISTDSGTSAEGGASAESGPSANASTWSGAAAGPSYASAGANSGISVDRGGPDGASVSDEPSTGSGASSVEASGHGVSTDSSSAGWSTSYRPYLPTAASPEPEASSAEEPVPAVSAEPEATDPSDPSESADEPVVPAPATPPRRQPRRAASRPAGPPVSARHEG
jgi:ribonuclease E